MKSPSCATVAVKPSFAFHADMKLSDDSQPTNFKLVYQSRSGAPTQPWLGPDVLDYLREIKEGGVSDVVIAPIGFISDHMEVIYDLDTEARQLCESIGLNMVRAATVGTHPLFIQMIRELILERLEPERERRFLGTQGPRPDVCSPDCCSLNRQT